MCLSKTIHMYYTYVNKNIDINANVAKEDSKQYLKYNSFKNMTWKRKKI